MTTKTNLFLALTLALCTACPDNVAPHSSVGDADDTTSGDKPYVPPTNVRLTPPKGHVPDGPTVSLDTSIRVVDMDVVGAGHRKLRCTLAGSQGQRKLEVAFPDHSELEIAGADFHLPPGAATDANGDMMICWNTLTGQATKYSPNAPDPATGMALRCRLLSSSRELGPVHRVPAPTVGCWLQKVVALPKGGFRVLYHGDDGWMDGEPENPLHGTYDAIFDGTKWSAPKLIVPTPDPTVEYQMPDSETDAKMPRDSNAADTTGSTNEP